MSQIARTVGIMLVCWWSLCLPLLAQGGEEEAVRTLVTQYFVTYGRKDAAQLAAFWSKQTPALTGKMKSLEGQWAQLDVTFTSHNISRIKIENARASLRSAIDLTIFDKKTQKTTTTQQVDTFYLVREDGQWKVLEFTPVVKELWAVVLATDSVMAQDRLLAEEDAKFIQGPFYDLLWNTAYQQLSRGNHVEAQKGFQLAVRLMEQGGNKSEVANGLVNLALAYKAQGLYDLTREALQKCITLAQEVKRTKLLALAYNNLCDLNVFQGRYAEALANQQRSMVLQEQQKQTGKPEEMADLEEAISYNLHNIGLIYRQQGRNDLALAHYRKSLQIREEIADKQGIASSTNNIGVVYKSEGQYQEAINWFQRCLKVAEEIQFRDAIASALNNIGDCQRELGDLAAAAENIKMGLQIRETTNARAGISRSLRNLGLVYFAQRNYQEALAVSQRAAQLAQAINAPDELYFAQENIGKALRAMGKIEEARQAFAEEIKTIEQLRQQSIGGNQQQSFLENKVAAYFELADILIAERQSEAALRYAEQSKARVLLDLLLSGRGSLDRVLSLSEKQEQAQAQEQLALLNSQLTRESQKAKADAGKITGIRAQLQQARLSYEALQARLYVAHPELKVKRGDIAPIEVAQTTSLLTPQTALLEFSVGDTKAHLFVITLREGKAALQTIDLPSKAKDLRAKTEQLRKYLSEKDLRYQQPARELYDLLLKPAEAQLQGKTRLIIVPDGPLWEVPWQALMPAPNRFLVEEKTISTAPSLTFLREMTRAREQRKTTGKATGANTILVVGNPALGNAEMLAQRAELMGDQLIPLPFAEQQAVQLGQLYKANAKVLLGASASESAVKTELVKHRILHLATHGVLDDRNPMYSHLVLAQTNVSAKEDGLLEARELLEMDLQADLAVLSACETGRGKIGAGEGMIGLTWALFVAGVPSTVVSHWKVADKSTAELMLAFHQQLQAKQPKAEALRRAALQMLKQPHYRHPFHWAGFTLVGDGN